MGITITNSGQGSVVRFRNLGRGGLMTSTVAAPLLNAYPGAAIACSLRKLRSDYTGFCIQVTRQIDSATLNIGFVNNVLDTATLSTFIGSGTGKITIWYDQSGNGNNLTKDTLFPQPQIINNGVLYTINSKPTILFLTNELLNFTTALSSFNPISLFLIQKANSTTNMGGLIGHNSPGGSGTAFGVGIINSNKYAASFGFNGQMKLQYNTGLDIGTNLNNMNMVVNSTNYYPYVNNTSFTFSTTDWSPSTTLFSVLGQGYPSSQINAYISEMIIYKTDQLSNRTGIVNNTNSYYSMF